MNAHETQTQMTEEENVNEPLMKTTWLGGKICRRQGEERRGWKLQSEEGWAAQTAFCQLCRGNESIKCTQKPSENKPTEMKMNQNNPQKVQHYFRKPLITSQPEIWTNQGSDVYNKTLCCIKIHQLINQAKRFLLFKSFLPISCKELEKIWANKKKIKSLVWVEATCGSNTESTGNLGLWQNMTEQESDAASCHDELAARSQSTDHFQ